MDRHTYIDSEVDADQEYIYLIGYLKHHFGCCKHYCKMNISSPFGHYYKKLNRGKFEGFCRTKSQIYFFQLAYIVNKIPLAAEEAKDFH